MKKFKIKNDYYLGLFFALSAVFLFSTLGTGMKFSVQNMDAFSTALLIGCFSTLFLFIYAVLKRGLGKIIEVFKLRPLYYIGNGVLCLGFQQMIYIKAYEYIPASQVVSILYTYPFFMLIFSWLIFKEKISWNSWLAILCGFVGVSILKYDPTPQTLGLNLDLGLGVILSLGSALSFALYSTLIKRDKEDVLINNFLFNLFGLLFLLCMMPFFWHPSLEISKISILHWSGLIYLGIFPTALAFILWNKALRLLQTSICSNVALLTPVLSILLILLIFKEQLGPQHIIGMSMIVGANLVNNLMERNK